MIATIKQSPPDFIVLSDENIPLTQVPVNASATLAKIDGGRRLRHRLTELGLIPGSLLTVVQNQNGPLLVAVRDTRLAIGRGMAGKILVKLGQPNV